MAKILALVTFKVFPPHMGGQKGVALFYKFLSRHHNIVIAASKGNDTSEHRTFNLLHNNKIIFLNLFSLSALKRIIQTECIECIIAEHSYTAWIAWLLKKQTGVPFIIHSHNIETFRFRQMKRWWWKRYMAYEKWMHQKADHNFFISKKDEQTAIDLFKLAPMNCSDIPYGAEPPETIQNAQQKLKKVLALSTEKILYFNGSLDYYPNQQAVKMLLQHLVPMLSEKMADFKIVISGKGATESLKRMMYNDQNVLFVGFTEHLNLYYQGCDVFLNPVVNDSGVKTKLIEALANSCFAVSTASGAAGVEKGVCGENLTMVPDGDWKAFAEEIKNLVQKKRKPIPPGFFEYYSWERIAAKAAEKINQIMAAHG